MAGRCAQRNPLARSGMTQAGRRRAELAPDYFLPDERDLADFVLFGQRFARHIRYYGADNKAAGDWRDFFESDVTASLAALAKLPVEAMRSFQLDLERWLKAEPGRDAEQLSDHARLYFHLPVALLAMAGTHHARLPGDHALGPEVVRLVGRELAAPLGRLVAWYRGAAGEDPALAADKALFADEGLDAADFNLAGAAGDERIRLPSTVAGAVMGRPALSAAPVPGGILGDFPGGDWAGFFNGVAPDASPYVDAATSANRLYEQILDALTYNLLSTAVEQVYQALERIRRDASRHLADSLESFGAHAPHYGLWLAFLQLYGHAKSELNRFTGRHLDFYFREVLRLAPRGAVPDAVHLLFELAKGYSARRLPEGTAFRAGKDAEGNPVSYRLESDIVVNRARVTELRGLQVRSAGTAAEPAETPLAAPVVRSRDGLGEVELPADAPAWPPFGPAASPAARMGIAVADRKLFLREGTRKIELIAELTAPLPTTAIDPRWIVRLTGDEGWFELSGTAQITTTVDNRYAIDSSGIGERDGPDRRGRVPKPGVAIWKHAMKRVSDDGLVFKGAAASKIAQALWSDAAVKRGRIMKRRPSKRRPRRRPEHAAAERVPVLRIEVALAPEDPPVVPLDDKLHGSEHAPGMPVMEVLLDFAETATARAFPVLREARARRVSLRAEASGLKNLMVLANAGVVDATQPFAPFGAQPRAGAALVIGSSEIFSKPVETWSLDLDWETTYSRTGFFWNRGADEYDPDIELLTGGRWLPPDGRKSADLGLDSGGVTTVELPAPDGDDELAEQTIDNPAPDATSVNGFLRMTLPRDFGHADYPGENARALIGLAGGAAYVTSSPDINTYTPGSIDWAGLPGHLLGGAAKGKGPFVAGAVDKIDLSGNLLGRSAKEKEFYIRRLTIGGAAHKLPKAPYDPVIGRLEARYETTCGPAAGLALMRPFGVSEEGTGRLFPDMPFEGALLIGVEGLQPPARLTMLVQVADGSGDPLRKAPQLGFAYLAGDRWVAFAPQDVDDKTVNLSGSGVLGLNVPEEADTVHRAMPAGLHWFRISAPRDADALNRVLSVDAQAARAIFADAGTDPTFLETPLPAGTIAKLVRPDPAIKKIIQPYSSFGGRPPEKADGFATRVSERLRHKDRAVTMFDYEALVLEAFPRLYRVMCLNTTELERGADNVIAADNELKPGAVTVVTVPWTHGQNARDPLRPYTDQATLEAVDAHLRRRISPFVRLDVQNPKFEEVHVAFKVRFARGTGDIAFHIDELNKAVIGFLTPWARPGGGEITFGGRLWKSSVIDFVEEQPGVDFVTDFRLYHKVDAEARPGGWSPVDVEVIAATTARSILVSAARHTIGEVAGDA